MTRSSPLRGGGDRGARGLGAPRGRATRCGAIEALGAFRLLCAHRRGPYGVSGWTALIEAWLG